MQHNINGSSTIVTAVHCFVTNLRSSTLWFGASRSKERLNGAGPKSVTRCLDKSSGGWGLVILKQSADYWYVR